MTGDPFVECARYEDRLAELALGILSGRERSEVLAHLERCPRCSGEVEQLSIGADALLHLAPETEPPVGFEVRVFERLGVRTPAPRRLRPVPTRWTTRWTIGAVAAMVVLGIGVGIGFMASNPPPAGQDASHLPTGSRSATAALVSDGERRGTAVISSGRPSWLFMMVSDAGVTGYVTCEVTEAGGKTLKVGTFWLAKGYGSWGTPLPHGAHDVTKASIVGSKGAILASASFRTA
jgi:anti-sigma factor RsiW